MTYAVQLRFSEPSRYYFENKPFFRIDVEVVDTHGGIPAEIFLWRKTLYDAVTGETHDEFQTVCSAYDLTTYPANAPNSSQTPPFYRRSICVLKTPSVTVADEAKAELEAMVAELCILLEKSENLQVAETIWIPSDPT